MMMMNDDDCIRRALVRERKKEEEEEENPAIRWLITHLYDRMPFAFSLAKRNILGGARITEDEHHGV